MTANRAAGSLDPTARGKIRQVLAVGQPLNWHTVLDIKIAVMCSSKKNTQAYTPSSPDRWHLRSERHPSHMAQRMMGTDFILRAQQRSFPPTDASRRSLISYHTIHIATPKLVHVKASIFLKVLLYYNVHLCGW